MGNSLVRSLVGALVAVPVALGLFFLMQALIDREYQQEDVKNRKIADIVVHKLTPMILKKSRK